MKFLNEICDFLECIAPSRLAEDWDNVGLLAGDRSAEVTRVMTCLTITPASAGEAIGKKADLIITHHPLPFRPIKKLTTESLPTRLLWDLIRNGIAIYSPHTGFDSAATGINQMICERLELIEIKPLIPAIDDVDRLGAGRIGMTRLSTELASFIELVKKQFSISQLKFVGDPDRSISVVASACGSGGSFLEPARSAGCDALITGEAGFHTCLEAAAGNIALILTGHFASERFAVDHLSEVVQKEFPDLTVWASEKESDPIRWA